jgi:hypothetical protein
MSAQKETRRCGGFWTHPYRAGNTVGVISLLGGFGGLHPHLVQFYPLANRKQARSPGSTRRMVGRSPLRSSSTRFISLWDAGDCYAGRLPNRCQITPASKTSGAT